MPIKIKLSGFEDMLNDIEKAGGSINSAVGEAIQASAQIMQGELKTQMQSAGVPADLANSMPAPKIEKSGNRFAASVGFDKGAYDPQNPSNAYKVIFLNYGTPKRKKHGKIKARGFIQKAKKRATPKIKKQQEKTFNEILARLKK